MRSIAILLTVYLASAFNLRELGNYTLKQQLSSEAGIYSRITNGKAVKDEQFPYQAGLRAWKLNGVDNICSGSLISNKWVLTAAHCTKDHVTVDVFLGSVLFHEPKVAFHHLPRSNIIEHKDYNYSTFGHDIGLIKIPETHFSKHINIVTLPPRDAPLYNGSYATLAGWGSAADKAKDYSPILLFFTFRIMRNDICANIFNKHEIYPGKLCTATWKLISGCRGDSGGPLVLANTTTQIGIFSFGSGLACELGFPNAFTRVSSYLEWIRSHTDLEV